MPTGAALGPAPILQRGADEVILVPWGGAILLGMGGLPQLLEERAEAGERAPGFVAIHRGYGPTGTIGERAVPVAYECEHQSG